MALFYIKIVKKEWLKEFTRNPVQEIKTFVHSIGLYCALLKIEWICTDSALFLFFFVPGFLEHCVPMWWLKDISVLLVVCLLRRPNSFFFRLRR